MIEGPRQDVPPWLPPLQVSFAVLVCLQVLDVLTTHAVLRRGGVEGSPLSQVLLAAWGFPGLAAGKAVLCAVSVAAGLALVRRGFAPLAARALFVVNGIFLVAIGWNAWQVWNHTQLGA